jgi:hypothetical protein
MHAWCLLHGAVSFAAGYIAGIFCAVVSHPADNLVSKMNAAKGVPASERSLGLAHISYVIGGRSVDTACLHDLCCC